MLAAASIAWIARWRMPARFFGAWPASRVTTCKARGEDELAGDERRRRRSPAHEADRAVGPQELAEHDGGDRHGERAGGHVEGHLHRRLAAQEGEDEGSGAGRAEDEEIGREEDQPDEERPVLQGEEDGVAAVVQRHRRQSATAQSKKMTANIAPAGMISRIGPEALERALQAEGDRDEGEGDGEARRWRR